MISLLLCLAAFAASSILARRSTVAGLLAVLATGYGYGIIRANLLSGATYFLFDSAVVGFFAGYAWRQLPGERLRTRPIVLWIGILIGWPVLVALLPLQTPVVTLVGLRGNIFFLPFLYVGTRLRREEITRLAAGIAVLNLGALAIALLEYVKGVQAFYPENAVTAIIYNSNDVAGYQFLRIPATFVTAHAYGGAMVATLPFLLGVWGRAVSGRFMGILLLAGAAAASAGVLLSAVRTAFIGLVLVGAGALLWGRFGWRVRWSLIAMVLVMAGISSTNERLQRFRSLSDSSVVTNRIGGSVNRTFVEILLGYPLGNGLGGGGTSIPQFLENEVRRPISIESEYGRILLEQGIIGLLIWVSFLFWVLSKFRFRGIWIYGQRLAYVANFFSFVLGLIGIGLLTSIPQTVLMMLAIGWTTSLPPLGETVSPPVRVRLRRPGTPVQVAYAHS